MPHNKIKQNFHFTTLKRFKIIKLTNFHDVCLFLSSLSIVSIFVNVEQI
jgi:hypothetical protein